MISFLMLKHFFFNFLAKTPCTSKTVRSEPDPHGGVLTMEFQIKGSEYFQ